MKSFFVLSFITIFCSSVRADYEHGYGNGHGGGHGFYGYPVGRKWGYNTYIKHPPPKHKGYGHGYGYGGHGHGYRNYGHGGWPQGGGGGHSFGPSYGSGYGPGYGSGYGGQGNFGNVGFDNSFGLNPGFGLDSSRSYNYGPPGYRPERQGQHMNHNYGNGGYGGGGGGGAHIKPGPHPTGEHQGSAVGDYGGYGLEFLDNDFPKNLFDLMPENFQHMLY